MIFLIVFNGLVLCVSQLLDILLLSRYELMKRRIQETDRYRAALQCLVKLLKVALLHPEESLPVQSSLSSTVSEQIISRNASILSALEEHMLGTAKTDTFCAKLTCLLCIMLVYLHWFVPSVVRYLSAQPMIRAELAGDRSIYGRDNSIVNISGGTINGNASPLHGTLCLPELNFLFASSIAISPHPDTQQVPIPRATTAAWHVMPPRTVRIPCDALHALDILRRSLQTYQYDLLTYCRFHAFASSAVEYNLVRMQLPEKPPALLQPVSLPFNAAASNCGCSRVSRLLRIDH